MSTAATDTEINRLLTEVQQWSPKAQEEFASRVERLGGRERKVWYCKRGRTCDGQPHDGVPYKHARGDQWPPVHNDWLVWFLRGGRGSGKTRTASEFVRKATKWVPEIACIGLNVRKIRQTMIEGRSGLIRICENAGMDYEWEPSKREFSFGNGAKAFMYSMEEPDSLRSPEHGLAWADEPSHAPLIGEVWTNLKFGLRIPGMPGGAKIIATSTPLPNQWTKDLAKHPRTISTQVSTYANLMNLDPAFRDAVLEEYEGTRLGQQELYGEILEDVIGALWTNAMIQYVDRDVAFEDLVASMDRIVVGVDPAGSADAKRDETGIIGVGLRGNDYFVLDDDSGHYTPDGWARATLAMARRLGADRIIAERNYGGEMVRATIKNGDNDARVDTVHSRRGKQLRAEPIVGRYEQQRVYHWRGLGQLEEQMTSWVPAAGPSPDRVDALVHAMTELGGGTKMGSVGSPSGTPLPGLGGLRR